MEIVSTIVSGQACPVIAYVKSREEMEKRLGALILEGATIISLDNVEEDVGGELLCMIATQQTIKIRILGLSEMKTCRWRGMIGGNGNNIGIRSDMARRTLIANLDAGLERPEQRRFRSDPVGRSRGRIAGRMSLRFSRLPGRGEWLRHRGRCMALELSPAPRLLLLTASGRRPFACLSSGLAVKIP